MNARQQAVSERRIDKIVGVSDWARQLQSDILRVAPHASSVAISGPTGTGKELIAKAIHAHSPRADSPYIPINCAAISGSLFGSHMFGHVKGAFTGAHYAALGCFRAADGGTIFLDEIGELEHDLQAKLLRVLQEKVVVPVGSHEPVPVDIRLITATNRDLKREVDAGRFREDLFYRLNVVRLQTLPLKDRPEDIQVLAEHCLTRLAERNGLPLQKLDPDAVDRLYGYSWPGNVRQLENVLERAAIFAEDNLIRADSLDELLDESSSVLPQDPLHRAVVPTQNEAVERRVADEERTASRSADQICRDALTKQRRFGDEGWLKLSSLERHHIWQTLEHTRYNQTAAAELLGVTVRMLYRKIKQYGIDTSRSRRGRPRKTNDASSRDL